MAKKTYPLVSIIIITYNSQKYVKDCLKALFKTEYPHFEVIVVDNGSSDQTISIVSGFNNVKVVKSGSNLGYAGGNNLGAQYAKGKYLAILNPDTQVSESWLKPLVETLTASSETVICQPKIMLLNKKTHINLTGKFTHYLGFEYGANYLTKDFPLKAQEITSVSGSVFLTRADIFKKVRGFDKDFFMYYEDGDLSWRFRSLGYKIYLIPESVVYHDYKFHPEENYQKAKKKFYLLERNRLVMILKNYSNKTLLLLILPIIFIEIGMNIYFLTKGWWLEKWKGYFWIIKHLKEIKLKRREINISKRLSDKLTCLNYESRIEFEEFQSPLLSYIANPILSAYWSIIRRLL